MIIKILIKSFFLFLLFFNLFAKANDISSMANISEAAGSSAQAAADQLASDATKVAENISGASQGGTRKKMFPHIFYVVRFST